MLCLTRRLAPLIAAALAVSLAACAPAASSGSEGAFPAAGATAEAAGAAPVGAPATDPGAAVARLWVSLGPGCVARGAAVFLGGDRFLTAAHLVDGSQSPPGCDGPPRAALRFRDQDRRARALRMGRSENHPGSGLRYLAGRDLALLRADPAPYPGMGEVPAARPCAAPPATGAAAGGAPPAGAAVLVVTPRRRAAARLLPTVAEEEDYGSYDEIDLRLDPGESGGAVFDAATGCLLGLVSHREEGVPRTRLVRAAAIGAFLEE